MLTQLVLIALSTSFFASQAFAIGPCEGSQLTTEQIDRMLQGEKQFSIDFSAYDYYTAKQTSIVVNSTPENAAAILFNFETYSDNDVLEDTELADTYATTDNPKLINVNVNPDHPLGDLYTSFSQLVSVAQDNENYHIRLESTTSPTAVSHYVYNTCLEPLGDHLVVSQTWTLFLNPAVGYDVIDQNSRSYFVRMFQENLHNQVSREASISQKNALTEALSSSSSDQ